MSEQPKKQSKQENGKTKFTSFVDKIMSQPDSLVIKSLKKAELILHDQYLNLKARFVTPQQKNQQKLEEVKINKEVRDALKPFNLPEEVLKTVVIASFLGGLSGQFNPKDVANVPQNVGKETEEFVKYCLPTSDSDHPNLQIFSRGAAGIAGKATEVATEVFAHKPFQAGHLAKEAINNATQATITPPTSVK